MKLPKLSLRRAWRFGLAHDAFAFPDGLSRADLEAAIADLPSDVPADELLEFVEAEGEHACPVFKERLRALLWGWSRHGYPTAAARRARFHLN